MHEGRRLVISRGGTAGAGGRGTGSPCSEVLVSERALEESRAEL